MASKQGAVRIGPVSILVVIIVLCLAVMAVLAFTTSEAEKSITMRQEESTTALYANEAEAQKFLAGLDAALADARRSGASVNTALVALGLPDDARYEDGVLTVAFVQDNGRRLDIKLRIATTASYEIMEWRATTEWNEEDPDMVFWSSSQE